MSETCSTAISFGRCGGGQVEPEWLEPNETSYILYTSGTTAKPKGVQRDVGGYAVALASSINHIFGGQPGDIEELKTVLAESIVQELRNEVRNLAFAIWLERVLGGGSDFGDEQSDWFTARNELGIPPDLLCNWSALDTEACIFAACTRKTHVGEFSLLNLFIKRRIV